MIVKLHGTSGSGKSTVARLLMEAAKMVNPLGANTNRPEGYMLTGFKKPLFIIGPYTTTCGGVDSITDWRETARLLHEFAAQGAVFYEGLVLSTYYGAFGAETERYGDNHVFAFMDTPIELCIQRIKDRRLEAGNLKPFNEGNTRERMKPINSLQAKLTAAGRNVAVVMHNGDLVYQMRKLLHV